ncbi:MAG: twin-arginine translocase TatA/TatE family subunit [Deltaproteobacteria bacterium]|nr:twin-arginine translocase TatA/TatE family subunit [Deltaproteobacteria bacterium]RLB89898.1 MAG: hypothetical protein DRH10_05080 [Deltaproteobacteria bacterium]RLB94590.1 MAG: hypothetical protein DRH50_06180 [Deltaproteobacteria bacterium]RLC07932.1 MAG: hypothetical protein DRH43_10945 [Deltaproteobacteria bacterium]
MFGIGIPEILIIALIILLIFGAKRLPGIGAGLGETVREVRKIKKDLKGKKPGGKSDTSESPPSSEGKSDESRLTESIQKKVASKMIEQVPGIREAEKIKDTADKIKKIVR